MWALALAPCWAGRFVGQRVLRIDPQGEFRRNVPKSIPAHGALDHDKMHDRWTEKRLRMRNAFASHSIPEPPPIPLRRKPTCGLRIRMHFDFQTTTASKSCPTSKMSHDHSGHDSCLKSVFGSILHLGETYDSTRRDRCGRWLWRLVRHFL